MVLASPSTKDEKDCTQCSHFQKNIASQSTFIQIGQNQDGRILRAFRVNWGRFETMVTGTITPGTARDFKTIPVVYTDRFTERISLSPESSGLLIR